MPKLLSRSKHEEFESNSALQIRDQKERRAKNARKLKLQFGRLQNFRNLRNFTGCEISQVTKLQPADTVPATPVFLQLHAFVVLLQFLVFSYFNPCNSFCFGFFVTSLTLSTYISLSLYKL